MFISGTAADTTTVDTTAITTPIQAATSAATATTKPPSWQNKLRDSRGRFVASTTAVTQ